MPLLHEDCGCVYPTPPDWENETVALVNALEARLGALNNNVGNAINTIVLIAKGGGAFTVTLEEGDISNGGATITLESLGGVKVAAIGLDNGLINEESFRKGDEGDTEEEQQASESITRTDAGTFYAGQKITIIKGQ